MPSAPDVEVLNVPILPGMREDIHRHAAAPPGTLRYAQNVRWTDAGAAVRRLGTTQRAVAATGAVELLTSNDGALYTGVDGQSYVIPDSVAWVASSRYSSAEPRTYGQQDVSNGITDLYAPQDGSNLAEATATEGFTASGIRVYAYSMPVGGSSNVIYNVQDISGVCVASGTVSNARRVRAAAQGSVVYLFVQRFSSHEIDVYRVDSTGAFSSATTALVTLDAATDSWDVSEWAGDSSATAFAWLDSSSTTITVWRLEALSAVATATQSTNVRSTSRITVYAGSSHLWLSWNDNVTSWAARVNCWSYAPTAFASVFTSSSVETWTATTQRGTAAFIGPGPSATEIRYAIGVHNEAGHATPDAYTWLSGTLNTSNTRANRTTQYNAYPYSKPFGPSGQYIWANMVTRGTPASILEPGIVHALCRVRDTGASGFYQLELIGHRQTESYSDFVNLFATHDWAWMPPVGLYNNYVAHFPIHFAGATELSRYYSFRHFVVGTSVGRRDFTRATGSLVVAGQPAALLTDAAKSTRGVDLGIHRAPVIKSLTASNGSGALTNNGVYSYIAVYRWVDGDGRIHRSAPSNPVSVTLGASDDTVAVVVNTLGFQRNLLDDNAVIEVYRTEDGGTTYHVVNDSLVNATTALTATFSDTIQDTAIQDNRILYTQAQQVPHDMAPACRWVRASETRVWAAGLWDPTIVQASKIIVPGEPVQWSDLDTFKVVMPEAVNGIAFMDGSLLVFGETAIYAVSTDGGPGNDGLASFSEPRLICPGLGCWEAASILETPIGVMFRSRRGFDLIPRGLGYVQPLPGVETTLETYDLGVTSACLRTGSPNTGIDFYATLAMFVVEGSGGDNIVLVYDIERQAWSVDDYPINPSILGTDPTGRMILANSNTASGSPYLIETAGKKDFNTFFESRLRFHDIYPFGPFKLGGVYYVIGRFDSEGSCTVNIKLGVDGGTQRTATWTLAATTHETYRQLTPPADQCRGTSVQLEAYDGSSGDADYGVGAWYGFAIVAQDKASPVLLTGAESA